jgi:hypothetical protein
MYGMAKELGLDAVREPHYPIRVPGAEGHELTCCLRIGRGAETYAWMSSGPPPLRVLMWRGLPQVGLRLGRLHGSCPTTGIF